MCSSTDRNEPKNIGTKAMTTKLVYAISIPSVVAGIFFRTDSVSVPFVPFKVLIMSSTTSAIVKEIELNSKNNNEENLH